MADRESAEHPTPASRRLGSVVGLVVGDAVGTTNEFGGARLGRAHPLTDMVGGGPFGLPAGAWTDDSSMALCLAESLMVGARHGPARAAFDPRDQMERYVRWWREGHLSSTGRCFDIGITTREALARFERTGEPVAGSTDPSTAGNGSVMRLAPVVAWASAQGFEKEVVVEYARESSRTTHGAVEAVDGCDLLARLLLRAYSGESILGPMEPVDGWQPAIREVALMDGAEGNAPPRPPTGYVVDTLACARWCVARGESFREAVLLAANLGGDADTIATVTGQLAGARWGAEAIPREWVDRLTLRERVLELAQAVAGAEWTR